MGKLARSWELTRQSWGVLVSDKQLVLFPLLSGAACLLVLASFAAPILAMVDWSEVAKHKASVDLKVQLRDHPACYVVVFAFYFVNFVVITFFNAALVACAISKFNGGDASVGTGLRVAASRMPQILAWSAVAATVGMVLNAIQERAGVVGKIVVGLIGMAWTIATFFVVPVLVTERTGPIAAVKRSVDILKKTWGESLVSNVGLGAVTGLVGVAIAVVCIAGVVAAVAMSQIWLAVVFGVLLVGGMLGLSLVTSALKGILLAATYEYAATGRVPSAFDRATLAGAFAVKAGKE